jgi:APA family basic amino acid/polyamine antiporter
MFLIIQTGTIAAVAVAFARFTGVLVPGVATGNYLIAPIHLGGSYAISLSTEQLVAVVMILLLTWSNTRGLELGKLVQNSFTFAKTAALIGLIVLGLALGWGATAPRGARVVGFVGEWLDSRIAQPGLAATGAFALLMLLGKAMVGPLFAQSAWNNVTFTGSEVRDPGRTLPRALLIGCGIVVTLYLLANVAYIATLPLAGIQNAPQNRVAVAAMNAILGPAGTVLMAIAIMISTFGCNNGLIMAGARVYYAMARDGLFFRGIAKLNRRQAPAMALVAQGVWASLLTLPRTVTTDPASGAVTYGNVYTQLLEYIISADLVFYVLMVGAVFVLRRKLPQAPRPYRTWGYPIVPVIYIAIAGLLIIDLAYLAPTTSGIGYILVLTGVPVYLAGANARCPTE